MKETVQKVKAHLVEHKEVYLIAVGCLTAGVVIGVVSKKETAKIINTVAPVFNNNNSSNVTFGGYMTKIVRCNETGELWESVKKAAEAIGTTPQTLSKVLNGHSDHYDGLTYSIIGMGVSV